jgi:hypothetical protein
MPQFDDFSLGKRDFRGCILWDRSYSDVEENDSRPLIIEVAADSQVVDHHRGRRASGPGGYFVAGYKRCQSEPSFAWHYETLDDLRDGRGTRKHPSLANFRAAVERAVRELFPQSKDL